MFGTTKLTEPRSELVIARVWFYSPIVPSLPLPALIGHFLLDLSVVSSAFTRSSVARFPQTLTILVFFSIDNTIRLAMYSNRFLIKTMQMVGATRGFIAKPINQRAVINGLIASFIAIIAVWASVLLIESFLPDFKLLHDNSGLAYLFLIIIF